MCVGEAIQGSTQVTRGEWYGDNQAEGATAGGQPLPSWARVEEAPLLLLALSLPPRQHGTEDLGHIQIPIPAQDIFWVLAVPGFEL
jgi:hypothetical protein